MSYARTLFTLFPSKRDAFVQCFADEIESWFTSSIAACDSCINSFAASWPGSVKRHEFQHGQIAIDVFIEGSRIRELFSVEEIELFKNELECPQCGTALNGTFWAYEHGFHVPDNFHRSVEELHEIA